MKQMLDAIAFCHSHDVLHRDLKASNVLVSQDGQLKLADFGLARFLPKQEDLTYRVCTLWYRCEPARHLLMAGACQPTDLTLVSYVLGHACEACS